MRYGNVLYYLLWPLIWFYSPLTTRVRVIIRVNKEALIVKNSFGSGHWSLPGGGIKIGESPHDAVVRETKEELGLKLDNIKQLTKEPIVFTRNGLIKRYHFFIVDLGNKPSLEKSSEIAEIKWTNMSDIWLPAQLNVPK